EGPWRTGDGGGREGEALRLGDGTPPDGRSDPDPGRLRIHEGVPGRAVLPRREDHGDLRGDERDPAARDRPLDPRPPAADARARLRRPLVLHVWELLLVAAPVGEPDRAQAVPLVEAAGALVLRERPEREALRAQLLRLREQSAADPLPVHVRVHVEVAERVVADRGEADEAFAFLSDPELVVARHDIADEAAVLLDRVDGRQEGQGLDR